MRKAALRIALAAIIVTTFFACEKETTGKADDGKTAFAEFTIDVSSGALASNGGSLVNGGALIARTNSGTFIAVTSVCTNTDTHVQLNYDAANNKFVCPTHGEQYDSLGVISSGTKSLTKYNTTLTGTSLRVYP